MTIFVQEKGKVTNVLDVFWGCSLWLFLGPALALLSILLFLFGEAVAGV